MFLETTINSLKELEIHQLYQNAQDRYSQIRYCKGNVAVAFGETKAGGDALQSSLLCVASLAA